jgi:hypothetical protein
LITAARPAALRPDRRGEDAWGDAERLLVALDAGESDPAASGDPFLLEQDYRDLAAQDVERLFGGAFAVGVAKLPVGRWSGPLARSRRGARRGRERMVRRASA